MREPRLAFGPDLVKLIAEIDEFKGRWEALKTLSPDRLSALRKVATIESVGSSTRIEGAKLSDAEVEDLLSRAISIKAFKTRDEQEVAGYAEAMDLVFEAHADMRLTENHIRQLHQTLLRHSDKDERHRGSYKSLSNNVVAFDAEGQEIGVVFETTSPFDTPREMEALVAWTRKALDEEALHPLLDHRRLRRDVSRDPSFSGWKRAALARANHAPLAASGLRLCALCLAGARDRGKQRAVLQGAAAHADDAKKRNAGLGALDWFFPALPQAAKGLPLGTARP